MEERPRITRPRRAGAPSRLRAKRPSRRLEDAAGDLVLLDRLEQRLEVALAEAVVALALNELEEDRPDHGLGEHLQQDLGGAARNHALAVDQDAVALHALERLGVAGDARKARRVVGLGRAWHEGEAVEAERVGRVIERIGADRDVLDAL